MHSLQQPVPHIREKFWRLFFKLAYSKALWKNYILIRMHISNLLKKYFYKTHLNIQQINNC